MKQPTKRRLTKQQAAADVAQALLHLGDICWLADSPLAELPEVQRRAAGNLKLFAEGEALAGVLREVVSRVIERLDVRGKPGVLRSTLDGVLDGKSISQIAREQGKTREHYSRSYWSEALRLVARELASLNKEVPFNYNANEGRKPSP